VDPHSFDRMAQRLAGSLTRRSVIAGAVLTVLGLGEAALARNRHQDHGHGGKRGEGKARRVW